MNLVDVVNKNRYLAALKSSRFGNDSNLSGVNSTKQMEREYFSVNIEARILLLDVVRNYIELGYIFAIH